MIKNLPNKFSQKMLLGLINEHHRSRYDFFYLPIDFVNKCNVGYAFINMIHPLYALEFYSEYHKIDWACYNSEKVCCISYARIQEKQALIQHFQLSKVMSHQDQSVKPVIFETLPPDAKAIGEIMRQYERNNKFLPILENEEEKSSSGD
jgi:RNA recognition motif 2